MVGARGDTSRAVGMLGISIALVVFLLGHAASATNDPRTVPHQHNASPFRIVSSARVPLTHARVHSWLFSNNSFRLVYSRSSMPVLPDRGSMSLNLCRALPTATWYRTRIQARREECSVCAEDHPRRGHRFRPSRWKWMMMGEDHPTPVRISCTAGMRLLPLDDQNQVYDALFEGLHEQSTTGKFSFTDLKRENVFTLDGEKEGFFGVVAANYLRGVVDAELKVIIHEQDAENSSFETPHHYVPQRHNVKRDGPLGALDMGGSSTQIVYRQTNSAVQSGTNEMSLADEHVPSHLNESEFFSTSFLSYGAAQFRERLWNLWVSEANAEDSAREPNATSTISNPCNFAGYRTLYRGHEFVGSGNAQSCKDQINRLIPHHQVAIDLEELYDENEQFKPTKMVGSVELPPIQGKFYGMSLYFFTLDFLRELSDHGECTSYACSKWPSPSIEEMTHALDSFCERSWSGDIEYMQHEYTKADLLPDRCFEAVYIVTLLRDGFGFHPSARDITFTHLVEGNEVEWSLGLALSEYAADRTVAT
ncbi:hypothetical protein THAOC_16159 [Thalassiosira oceanica]|uniref:Uncharacterized protein n=1 Tax=Thalassiosira oceanica TaxID=159749 RepID=K0SQD3_THAOC|nr:hypothetical protein THAOC_16159 [Thalassiosira oceanica]|eukprot:EJK63201.1 hypothetical protein THAOC_16159 [Thalassiosira oceanica]